MNAMSGLLRRFGRREARDTSKLVDLFVMIDGSGWRLARARPADGGQESADAVRSGAPVPNAGNAGSPIEAAFADAARSIGNPRSIGRLHILLDDPGGAYVDLLKSNLATAGSQALHEYAAELVGLPRVAWGRARVTESDSPGMDAQVMGIQGLVDLNGYLTRLDEHAVKVKRLVPVLDLIRRHLVTGDKTGSLCGLYVAGRYSHLMLTHPERGGVLARVIHTGREDFVDALRSGMGIDAAEAASMLSERDLLSGIAGTEGTDVASDVSRSAVDRAIGGLARRYTAAISETLAFFADQRVLGRPAEIKILDTGNRLQGLDHLVGEHVGIGAEMEAFDPFAAFRAMPLDNGLNLLEETSSDLRIGSISYRVHQGHIRSVEEIAREDRLQAAAAPKSEVRPRAPERRGRGRSRRSEQNGGVLSRLLAGRARQAKPDGATATDLAAQERQVGLLAILLIMVAGYFGYLEIEDQDRRLRNEINILGATYRANVDLKQGRDEATRAITRGGEIDKVLWTEKFLSLAENMNESMWLTDVYLEVNNRTIGESEIEEKKLVIQGAVLPSTDGHILQIAEFVERLEQDKQGFMDDFREIVFDGAYLDRGESDAVVRFTIEARYDAKKRQTVIIQAKRPAASSLGEATQKVEERKKAQEKAIGGNTQ
jgi:hypothetical protein